MKDTLEYKILKYLSENDNGSLINVNLLSENKDLLNKSIIDLKNKKLVNAKRYISNDNGRYFLCQITFEGKIFFNALKSDNNNIENYDSDFLSNPIPTNTQAIENPNNKPVTKSILNKSISSPWLIGLTFALLAAVFNANRVMKFINNIIDNL